MDRLEEIRQRTEAASRGPWNAKTNCHPQCNGEPWGWIAGATGNIVWSGSKGQINADFIAHSREDIPYLLSEVTELTELLNASKAGQLTLQKAWEQDKDELTARAEAAEAERDGAVKFIPHICCYCKKDYYSTGKQQCKKQKEDGIHAGAYTCGEFEWRGQRAGKGGPK
jgi:hypothetical protein